jgi:hypothetical protein
MTSDSHNAPRGAARIVGVDAASLDEAARILLAGGLVAVPTETVYGLAADATNGAAVASIFTAKGRPAFNPLICHVASLAMAESLAHVSPLARRLAERFWPGPLTLVLPRKTECPVSELATAGLPSIGLRIGMRGLANHLSGDAGELLPEFERVLLDRGAIFLEAGRATRDEVTVSEAGLNDFARHRVREGDIAADIEPHPDVRPLRR